MTRRILAPNFDCLARLYRWMEYFTFGRALAQCRSHFLPYLQDRRSALVLGDGDGRFLARLLADNMELRAEAVDSSAAMLHQLVERTRPADGRLHTRQCDALDFTPTGCYDLVVTHFFLDCFDQSEVETLAIRFARHVSPNALWLVSDFCIPPGLMHFPARFLIRSLYLAFRLLTGLRTHKLPDHASALASAGFIRVAHHSSLAGLLTSEIWQAIPSGGESALHSFHAIAATAP